MMHDSHLAETGFYGSSDSLRIAAGSISGLRRFVALLLDALLVATAGFIVSWPFSDYLASLGPQARWIGLPILVAYFGGLNSSIGNGQTIGKRVLNVRTIGYDGKPVPLLRSLLRAFVLVTPFIANGAIWTDSPGDYAVAIFLTIAVFLVFPANAYLFIFNRNTRQGLHDIIARTYVVNTADPDTLLPSNGERRVATKVNLSFVAVHALLLTFTMAWLSERFDVFRTEGRLDDILAIQESLMRLDEVSHVAIGFDPDHPKPVAKSYFDMTIYFSRRPTSIVEHARQLMCGASREYAWLNDKSRLTVTGKYGYDIGVWSYWQSESDVFRPDDPRCAGARVASYVKPEYMGACKPLSDSDGVPTGRLETVRLNVQYVDVDGQPVDDWIWPELMQLRVSAIPGGFAGPSIEPALMTLYGTPGGCIEIDLAAYEASFAELAEPRDRRDGMLVEPADTRMLRLGTFGYPVTAQNYGTMTGIRLYDVENHVQTYLVYFDRPATIGGATRTRTEATRFDVRIPEPGVYWMEVLSPSPDEYVVTNRVSEGDEFLTISFRYEPPEDY